MNIILDLIVVAILALCIAVGYKKGFIKGIMGLVSGIIALVLAFVLTPTVGGLIDSAFVSPVVEGAVTEQLEIYAPDGANESIKSVEEFITNAPQELSEFLSGMGLDVPEALKELSTSQPSTGKVDYVAELGKSLASPVSAVISGAIAFILIYLAAIIILKIIVSLLDGVFSLPILKLPNKLLGAVLGAVTGVIACFAVCTVIAQLLPYLANMDNPFFKNVTLDKTLIFRFFVGFDAIKELVGNIH